MLATAAAAAALVCLDPRAVVRGWGARDSGCAPRSALSGVTRASVPVTLCESALLRQAPGWPRRDAVPHQCRVARDFPAALRARAPVECVRTLREARGD